MSVLISPPAERTGIRDLRLAAGGATRRLLGALLSLLAAIVPVGNLSAENGWDGDYIDRVAPVLNARCVACHSCYNAPCQLDLSSWTGLRRGASSERVYDGTRLTPVAPTRLYIDAANAAEWHQDKGFFSVLPDPQSDSASLLQRMLAMKSAAPTPVTAPHNDWHCPSNSLEMAAYELAASDGMPFGFPALSGEENAILMQWLAAGAPGPKPASNAIAAAVASQIEDWETWLNRDTVHARLVARYVYEHLFLAHLYFAQPAGRYFRLVRSRTPPGEQIDEIATVRPYDAPGTARFYYRLRALEGSITHKTHLVFPLTPARLKRYETWLSPSARTSAATTFPPYGDGGGHNPFQTFAALPASGRYRFLLDNSHYFIMSFIRGPVCEGQMAVNVINDHFQVFFLEPEHDLAVTDPEYLATVTELLELPSAGESDPFESYYASYKSAQKRYTAAREARYAETWPDGQDLAAIWNGQVPEPNAWLTVFRHFDNASVVTGGHGGLPKTVWVIDYPIFERIYYLLVAGFNVYGNAFHQASTRLYMDNLRVESEDNFLAFLPPPKRMALRNYWYRGNGAKEKMEEENPLRGAERDTLVKYSSDDPKGEWLGLVRARLGAADPAQDPLQNATAAARPAEIDTDAAIEVWLAHLVDQPLPFVQAMPDVALLSVSTSSGTSLYSLIRNKAHTNVSFLRGESDRRVPDEDTLSVMRGVVGSYPNYLFRLKAGQLPQFVDLLLDFAGTRAEQQQLWRGYGASRYEADFWQAYDHFNHEFQRQTPLAAGILDLSKYSYR